MDSIWISNHFGIILIPNHFGITLNSNPIRLQSFCNHIILVVKDLNSLIQKLVFANLSQVIEIQDKIKRKKLFTLTLAPTLHKFKELDR